MCWVKAIVYSNVWIALGAFFYGLHTYLMVNLKPNVEFLLLTFFATLFSYNFQRLVRFDGIENKSTERLQWMERHLGIIKLLTIFSFIISAFLALFYFTLNDLLLSLPAFLIVIFYATFFSKKSKGLRSLPFVKIFMIASVWAYVLGVYPLLISGETSGFLFVFLDKFCFILAITIPFDIRDLLYDKSYQKTIPMLFGVLGSKIVALVFLAVSFYINLWFVANIYFLVGFYLITAALILLSNNKKPELFYSGLIDGLLVLSPMIYYMI